ncbi:hypothetical protein Q1695_012641 [Nippostrongylus brasiliensis]|nr:hypothetical protein Q1695_012641 [Nippostrongylus brasiliensis]
MGQLFSSGGMDRRKATELKIINDDFIEAEIALKNVQFAEERALKIIQQQEQFMWEFFGASTMIIVLVAAGAATKRKDFAVPIAPLVLGTGYRYDCAFGRNHETVKEAAETLLKKNDPRIQMVGGPLTLKEVDAYRARHFC